MSTIIDSAIAALNEKIAGKFGGNAKFVVEGEGSIMLDNSGARAGDDAADVTLSADVETRSRAYLMAASTRRQPS
jgi:hypothetical protein